MKCSFYCISLLVLWSWNIYLTTCLEKFHFSWLQLQYNLLSFCWNPILRPIKKCWNSHYHIELMVHFFTVDLSCGLETWWFHLMVLQIWFNLCSLLNVSCSIREWLATVSSRYINMCWILISTFLYMLWNVLSVSNYIKVKFKC